MHFRKGPPLAGCRTQQVCVAQWKGGRRAGQVTVPQAADAEENEGGQEEGGGGGGDGGGEEQRRARD